MEEASGPKPPAAPKQGDEEEDEFDGASTTSDWRRNAMDFEVPADAANKPAFNDEHLETADFPSESDYPPRRVRVPEPVEEAERVAQEAAPARLPAAEESAVVEPAPVLTASSESSAEPAEKPVPSFWSKIWGKSESKPQSEPQPEAQLEQAPQSAGSSEAHEAPTAAPEPKSVARELPAAAHWMDALAPNQINATGGDWMNSLAPSPSEAPAAAQPAAESVEQLEIPASTESASQPEVTAAVESPAAEDLFPVSQAVTDELPMAEAPAPSTAEAEAAESWFAPTPSVFSDAPDPVSATVPVAHAEPDHGLELDAVEGAALVSLRDPNLVASPAVHVTPEPLLVDETPTSGTASEYNTRFQEVQPLYSYFSPASGDRAAEPPSAEPEPEPSFAAREEMPVPSFEPPASEESSERIPTGPPPDREALASIPFLNPPADFRAGLPAPEPAAPNPGTVDEVVKKVLERLEPQIHDLLSQGVLKPLVENLLQNELAKKEK